MKKKLFLVASLILSLSISACALPFAKERDLFAEPEEEPMEETQILTPVEEPVQQETINFCPDCGADMREVNYELETRAID